MAEVVVLGAGMVGCAIAADLRDENKVTVVDRDAEALRQLAARHSVETVEADLSDAVRVREVVESQPLRPARDSGRDCLAVHAHLAAPLTAGGS